MVLLEVGNGAPADRVCRWSEESRARLYKEGDEITLSRGQRTVWACSPETSAGGQDLKDRGKVIIEGSCMSNQSVLRA